MRAREFLFLEDLEQSNELAIRQRDAMQRIDSLHNLLNIRCSHEDEIQVKRDNIIAMLEQLRQDDYYQTLLKKLEMQLPLTKEEYTYHLLVTDNVMALNPAALTRLTQADSPFHTHTVRHNIKALLPIVSLASAQTPTERNRLNIEICSSLNTFQSHMTIELNNHRYFHCGYLLNLSGAVFKDLNLDYMTLTFLNLYHAKFENTFLSSTRFDYCSLDHACFTMTEPDFYQQVRGAKYSLRFFVSHSTARFIQICSSYDCALFLKNTLVVSADFSNTPAIHTILESSMLVAVKAEKLIITNAQRDENKSVVAFSDIRAAIAHDAAFPDNLHYDTLDLTQAYLIPDYAFDSSKELASIIKDLIFQVAANELHAFKRCLAMNIAFNIESKDIPNQSKLDLLTYVMNLPAFNRNTNRYTTGLFQRGQMNQGIDGTDILSDAYKRIETHMLKLAENRINYVV